MNLLKVTRFFWIPATCGDQRKLAKSSTSCASNRGSWLSQNGRVYMIIIMSDGLFAKKEKRFDSVTTNYSLLILI